MVRLKASKGVARADYEKISIPYGSIKSLCPAVLTENFFIFQFLMVRLKGLSYPYPICWHGHFNSLWFD